MAQWLGMMSAIVADRPCHVGFGRAIMRYMTDKIPMAQLAPNLAPVLQFVDYWTELAAITSYAWFNGAMIIAAGVAKEDQ